MRSDIMRHVSIPAFWALAVLILPACISVSAQTPAQINALDNSTTIWSPYAADTPSVNPGAVGPLDWGATYTDTLHTSSGNPLSIFRLPSINTNCSSGAYSGGAQRPNVSVTYLGSYWYVPYSAGVESQANFTLTTNGATSAGNVVLNFASTSALNALVGYVVTGANIPANTTVASFTATTVTLSANVTASGVASGATITFANPPSADGGVTALAPWHKAANQAETCTVRSLVPSYSSRQAWNADQTELYTIGIGSSSGTVYFYSQNNATNPPTIAFDFELLNSPIAGNNESETWSHSNPNVMYYNNAAVSGPPAFNHIDITSCRGGASPCAQTGVVDHVFTQVDLTSDCPAGTSYVDTAGSGNPSTDDRYWAFACAPSSGRSNPTRFIVFDRQANAVIAKRDVHEIGDGDAICPAAASTDWIGMSPSGNYVIVNWIPQLKEDTWTTCSGVELFDRQTLTSQGMVFSLDAAHGEPGYDVNGYEVMVAPQSSHLTGENNDESWAINVTKLSDVHAPPYGSTTTTSYVRRYYMPCTYYSSLTGTDPYKGCSGSGANGSVISHLSGRAAEYPTNYGQFLLSTLAYNQYPAAEEFGWGRSENLALTIDTNSPSQLYLTTNASTTSGNVLHFASTVPPGGIYTLLSGNKMYVAGSHIADNTTITSFDGTSVTLSNNVTATVNSGSSITFYMRLPFHRVSRTAASRYGSNGKPQCSSGDDYWQEPHATVNRTFTQLLFATSWITECGQVGAMVVNLPGASSPVLTVTPANQTVMVGAISWTAHNPASGYSWSISPADCVTNSGSGSGDGSTISATCNTAGPHALTVSDGTTTVYPTFTITAYAPLTITPGSVSLNRYAPQTFTASGGLAPYTWSAPGASTTTGTGTTFTTSWATARSYSLTVTDAASNMTVATVNVFSPTDAISGNTRIRGRTQIQ